MQEERAAEEAFEAGPVRAAVEEAFEVGHMSSREESRAPDASGPRVESQPLAREQPLTLFTAALLVGSSVYLTIRLCIALGGDSVWVLVAIGLAFEQMRQQVRINHVAPWIALLRLPAPPPCEQRQ